MLNLFLHELKIRWRAVVGWGIGLTAFSALYVFVWPQAEEQMVSLSGLAVYEAMGVSMDSFESYVGSVVILFLPLLLGIYGIVNGTRTLGGEEDDGTLELLMARPLTRWQIVIAKAAAMGISLIVILLVAGAGNAALLAGLKTSYETTLASSSLFAATLTAWPIAMAFAMISLFLGALTPNRRIASMAGAVILIASYFGENASAMVESLDFARPFSLFTYFDTSAAVFTEGAAVSDQLILSGVALVFLVLALVSFQVRNLTVGQWSWQRGRAPAQG